MRKKLAEAMAKGIELERDRCMRVCTKVITTVQKGLNMKLMSTTEKHTAQVKFNMAQAFVGAVQMKIMTGEDPDGNPVQQGPGGSDRDDQGVAPGA